MWTNYRSSGTWYGPVSDCDILQIKEGMVRAKTEKELLRLLLELFKWGDFSQKPLFIELLNHTDDEVVLHLGIKVFCSICTHEDLRDPDNLYFLGDADAEAVQVFASAAVSTLSLEVIPYLLALLEHWDERADTSRELRDTIDTFTDCRKVIGNRATVDELGQAYIDYTEALDMQKYYYRTKPAFPGDLTKVLMERVFMAANQGHPLGMEQIPALLSIWSGEKVPGESHTVIHSGNYQHFVAYVQSLAKKSWEKGAKYFYGHQL
ncbi:MULTISPECIES: Imm47 family immunity protein [Paenibacillus]|uniref:Imm47 family immunity protein n=1 Tax=Paenibacillus TaxID=44249 RepID=UPI002FE0F55E